MYDADVVEWAMGLMPGATSGAVADVMRALRSTQRMKDLRDSRCDCRCDPYAHHSFRCSQTPLFMETVYAVAEEPGYVDPFGPELWHWDMRWVCIGPERGPGSHTGGIVNYSSDGHWCPLVDRWVEGEELR